MSKANATTHDSESVWGERTGRSMPGYQFYCKECGAVFGTCNDIVVRDYSAKRLESVACEVCGAKNWGQRVVMEDGM